MNVLEELRAAARKQLVKGTWAQAVAAGWTSLESDGATFRELAVVLEEVGRAAARGPYLSTAALAPPVVAALPDGRLRDEVAEDIAGGTQICVAIDGRTTKIVPSTGYRISRRAEGYRLTGSAEFLLDAPEAGRLLVPAADDGGAQLVAVLDAADVQIDPQPLLDETRAVGSVRADDVLVPHDRVEVLGYESDLLVRLRDRATVALAVDALGVGEAVLARTVEYVRVRQQFNRPIGSFQAVKHACADVLTELTIARELVDRAVDALVEQHPDAWIAAAMAKSYATEAAVRAAGAAMQLHGGIGYTWESGIHGYLKRAMADRELFGSPAEHRALLAYRYGGR